MLIRFANLSLPRKVVVMPEMCREIEACIMCLFNAFLKLYVDFNMRRSIQILI